MTEERLAALEALAREGSTGWQGGWHATEGWLAEMEAFVSESLKALPELIAEVQRLRSVAEEVADAVASAYHSDTHQFDNAAVTLAHYELCRALAEDGEISDKEEQS